ncbi:hypothetical protein TVAG_479690 [Trichomonas vaginalis G3]|uniref:RING-type domain-containing protein n=1 Tax=Trichomonas vaginalis (strain ATCC PRA-98 / G3) TaxID=412133 RepID=A2FLN1_TRIV3|nr:zinc finger, RING/FYVE/PHD-type domain-containing protein [Trichomonas vaginalis G3]EAX94204.1 hypothetical protein TVAG_479690 [Trichomonas vaginalis G3]KAI5498394.1 zinc finger, RING/FYVE/PHD-type domain-containing protein [Trichomonas vaginalis G3]|eukprot:XP_001307134.1 hypothetical protein [Trichomonas vaginalis G3]
MFKPTLRNYVNDALQLEKPIDELKYLSKELSETITHEADEILAHFAEAYEYLKNLSLEELKTKIQFHYLEKFSFLAPEMNLDALEDPNLSIEEHFEVLKDCIQKIQNFNHELMIINSKLDNELRGNSETRQIKGENEFINITSKYVNQLNTTRTYCHDISIALSNFDMALSNIPLLDKNLFSEHAVYMISAEMPSLIQMNCKIDHLKDKIQEKVDNFNRIKRQTENLIIETRLYNETRERIKSPKNCKECLLEPVFYPSCGHVMCRNCWKTCNNICPVCGQAIEYIIDINWEN